MKILNCFKVVPDLESIADGDWVADDQLQVDTSYGKLLWNCFDEGALEMMLKLSDLSEGFDVVYELNVLTVGRRRDENFLKTLYALGFFNATRVETEEDLSFCPEAIAEAITEYVSEKAPQDLIVMGTQSSDGSNMKTPLLVAEKLAWPCIIQVKDMFPVDENHIKVVAEEHGRTIIQVVKTPCVLAVENAVCSYLRVPTLKEKMRLGKKPIEHITSEKLEISGREQNVKLVGLEPQDSKRDTVVITGDTPEEKAQVLYETYLKEKLKNLTDTPESTPSETCAAFSMTNELVGPCSESDGLSCKKMKYHFVVDGYSKNVCRQIEEFNAFKEAFLEHFEEGEAYILGSEGSAIRKDYSPQVLLEGLCQETSEDDLYIFGSGPCGTELAVRLAERVNGSSVAAVHSLEITENLMVKKMVYSNHMEGMFQMKKGPFCISLAKGMERKKVDKKNFCTLKEIPCRADSDFVVTREIREEETTDGLESAKFVIAAGRGVKSKENVKFLEETAKALGGEQGVSRPVAMNAWSPMSKLIGVSGAMIHPEICITAGVSGAAAFFAGIEKSKFIVAINTDEKAPIMKKADVVIADDYETVIKAFRQLAEN
ncbi:FAD-binding protein [Muricomes intestini]|uniref:FAD-binding protein n=1 Tax=Muricomes intestini TaxID=1796634 RepID=UPI002FE23445